MHFEIKQPKTETELKDYFRLRWELLRAPWNQPEGSEIDAIEAQCFHLTAITGDKVIGVSRLQFNDHSEAQIRYMAVSDDYRRNGIGRKLISTMEKHAINSHYKKMVLDAREPAVVFYEKLGYKVVQKSYLLFDEIQHYQMVKQLAVN